MKWNRYWWGIEIVAQSREDEKVLNDLYASLNKVADNDAVQGTMEKKESPETGEGGFTLEFV